MTRRRWIFASGAALVVVGVLAASGTGTRAWRAAYPYLPARVQAVPYRLAALVRRPATPVALPTPRPPGPAEPPSSAVPPGAQPGAQPAATMHRPATDPPTSPSTPLPTPGPIPTSITGTAQLSGVTHAYQTWNNCGPATISMALSVLGLDEGQAQAAVRLKPNPNDKNVSLDELARYAAERGAATTLRYGGRIDALMALVRSGWPVIVETWFEPEPGDEMGHYRLVTGFDAERRTLTLSDSYLGPAITEPFDRFDADWRAFDRALLVVHPPQVAPDVVAIVGDGGAAMWIRAAATASEEIARNADAFGWFNLGTSLQGSGDSAGAATAFDRARAIGLPWRMLWYQFAPFEAYASVGRWSDVKALADANLKNAADLEESWYWLGRARDADGDRPGAIAAWRGASDLNPLYEAPANALAAVGGGAP
ncbi:MAG: C39 family peptidase [Ardenticatenales bacterium]